MRAPDGGRVETAAVSQHPGLPVTYVPEYAEHVAGAIVSAGIDWVVYLPCSTLHPVQSALAAELGDGVMLGCTREDNGIGYAWGASLTGHRPAVMMEGSGLGYSALVLARAAVVNRAELLLVVSHGWNGLGERMSYHAASRASCDCVVTGLRIPHVTLTRVEDAELVFREMVATMSGQATPAAVIVPPYLCREVPL